MTQGKQDPSLTEAETTRVFSARRLTIARQHRGRTKKWIAERIGKTAQAITSYEDGTHAPSVKNSRRLADELEFDIGFFFADDVDEIPLEAISFRSRRALTARVRDKTKSCNEIAAGIVSPALSRRFRLPQADVPDYTGEKPEDAASFARAYWELGQGPISNMVHLLEAKGVETYWFNEDSPYVDAVSFWRDGKPFALASLRHRGGERLRFDLAHELGHLALHRGSNDLDSREVESEANRFASAFLLPEPQFRLECPLFPILRQFFDLKPRWKASVWAMIRRSRDMGLLSQWQYQGLCKEMSSQWGRMTEPCQLPFEESALQPQVFARLAAKDVYAEDLALSMRLRVDDLINLMPTASRFRRQEDKLRWNFTIEELGYEPHP